MTGFEKAQQSSECSSTLPVFTWITCLTFLLWSDSCRTWDGWKWIQCCVLQREWSRKHKTTVHSKHLLLSCRRCNTGTVWILLSDFLCGLTGPTNISASVHSQHTAGSFSVLCAPDADVWNVCFKQDTLILNSVRSSSWRSSLQETPDSDMQTDSYSGTIISLCSFILWLKTCFCRLPLLCFCTFVTQIFKTNLHIRWRWQ